MYLRTYLSLCLVFLPLKRSWRGCSAFRLSILQIIVLFFCSPNAVVQFFPSFLHKFYYQSFHTHTVPAYLDDGVYLMRECDCLAVLFLYYDRDSVLYYLPHQSFYMDSRFIHLLNNFVHSGFYNVVFWEIQVFRTPDGLMPIWKLSFV